MATSHCKCLISRNLHRPRMDGRENTMRINVVTLIIFMGVFSFGVGIGTLFFMPTFYFKERIEMKNENIGYIDDNTTCNGENGTPLTTEEEEEVTEWYIESIQ